MLRRHQRQSIDLARGVEKAHRKRSAFSYPRNVGQATDNDYHWSSEKMVAAHPQGGKNAERS
jgi:hypothetical protein